MGYNDDAKQMMVRLQPNINGKLVEELEREIVRLGPEAFKLLITFPETLVYAGMRGWVAKIAMQMKRENVLPILFEALSHPDWRINQIAHRVFAMLGAEVKDLLVENLKKSENDWGRYQTILGLQRLADPFGPFSPGDKSLISHIENAAKSDESEVVRGIAIEVLSRSEAFEAEDTMVKALDDSDESVRRQAVKACRRLRLKKAVKPLIKMLEGSGPETRAEIIYTLDHIGDVKAAEAVRKMLAGSDWYVRWNAVKALENLWEEVNIEPLKRSAEDDNPNVAIAAAETLALKAPEEAKDTLEKASSSGNQSVKTTADFYLEKLGKIA